MKNHQVHVRNEYTQRCLSLSLIAIRNTACFQLCSNENKHHTHDFFFLMPFEFMANLWLPLLIFSFYSRLFCFSSALLLCSMTGTLHIFWTVYRFIYFMLSPAKFLQFFFSLAKSFSWNGVNALNGHFINTEEVDLWFI